MNGSDPERSVYCTTGGKTLETIRESRAGVGLNPYYRRAKQGHEVAFLDYPFNREWSGSLEDYLELAATHQPDVVVAPDVMASSGLSGEFLAYADRLNQHAGRVVVVPKSVHPELVPDRFMVGIPCANGWGTSTWGWREYERHGGGVHLLGGTPNTHLDVLRSTRVDVRSVDTAVFFKGCYYDVWDGKWTDRDVYGLDYYGAIRESIDNLWAAVNRFGPRP